MIWAVFLLFFSFADCGERNEDKLIHTQVVFRHGDRTIIRTYKLDPYKDKSHWPEGFGMLINGSLNSLTEGKIREYQLGEFLQRRYGKFLGTYSPDKLSVLSSNFDRTINSANKDVHEPLDIEYRTNKTLPEWTREVFIPGGGGALDYLKTYWIKFLTGTDELKRLKSGFLLKEILDRFWNKTLSLLPDELMRIFSGHDITIASLLNTLGVFELHTPPYGSSLIFELYESNDSHYVQLVYRNTTAEHLTPISIPNCGTKCKLNEFYELYSGFLASDFQKECAIDTNE